MKKQPQILLSKERKEEIREVLKKYFAEELEIELSSLQADIFIEFLSNHVGKHYYNLGVLDVIAAIKEKSEDLVLLMKE
jgi:uncharacterized protein (DUF2164 family)